MSEQAVSTTEVDLSKPPAENMVRVTFLPEGRTVEFEFDTLPYEGHGRPMSFLDVAENYGIFLDHACGGVCACTTCHLHVKEGASGISEAEDLELDRLETAAGIELKAAVDGGKYKVIRQEIDRLDKATHRFAEVMMDLDVMGAMKGQTMEAAGESMGEAPTAPHPFAKAEFEEGANEEGKSDEKDNE